MIRRLAPCALFAVASFAGLSVASAQATNTSGLVTINGEMAVPVYSFRNVQERVSFRGFGADVRYFLHPMFSVGGSTSIQLFNDEFAERTVTRPDGAVTATLHEYTQFWQVRGVAHYYPLGRAVVAPYIGVGAGYGWANRLTLVTDFSLQDTASAFVVTPELGALFNIGDSPAGLMASARYNFSTASPDRVDSLSFLSFALGGYVGY
jgi:hypothetical protein